MGLAMSGVMIRQNVNQFKAEQIMADFFGVPFKELKEDELFNQDYKKRFDARYHNCVSIYKTLNFIVIINSDFTYKFYNEKDQSTVRKTYDYFGKPVQIFVFENYDSGGTYSYSVITDGHVVRYYRELIDKTTTYGKPLNIELQLLNAERVNKKDSDGEMRHFYINPHTRQLEDIEQIGLELLREVMMHEVELSPDNVYNHAIERRNFRIT